jgi:hypothetical protein
MGNTWVTDLTHILTDEGEIGPKSGPARRLAKYFTKIVVDATTEPWENPGKKPVRCRRRPGRKPCAGLIGTDMDPDTDAIMWWCPACGDNGTITNWQGSRWDRTDVQSSEADI